MDPEILASQYANIVEQLRLGLDAAIAGDMDRHLTPSGQVTLEMDDLVYHLNDWIDQAQTDEGRLLLQIFLGDVRR